MRRLGLLDIGFAVIEPLLARGPNQTEAYADGIAGQYPLWAGGFNWSAQHLPILRGKEMFHGDVTDLIHGSAEGRAVGAMEERAKCCGHLAGAGKEEQDRR
jgi:hypothetical protein